MSFHYDARADSSDDEQGGIDLDVWKSSAGPKIGSKAFKNAPPVMNAAEESIEREDSTNIDARTPHRPQVSQQAASPSPVAPVSAFQPINRRLDVSAQRSRSSSDDELALISTDLGRAPARASPGLEWTPSDLSHKRQRFFVKPNIHVNVAEYEDYTAGEDVVRSVLRMHDRPGGGHAYEVMFEDLHVEKIPRSRLLNLANGLEALGVYNQQSISSESAASSQRVRPTKRQRMLPSERARRQIQNEGFVSTIDNVEGSDIERGVSDNSTDELEHPTGRSLRQRRKSNTSIHDQLEEEDDSTESSDEEDDIPLVRSNVRKERQNTTRKRRTRTHNSDEDEPARKNTRHSERATRHTGGMREVEIDDIYRSGSDAPRQPTKPKMVSVREVFKPLPRGNDFRLRHNQYCDTCGQGANFAALIDCQGCSLAYHKSCLGHRTGREHLVTKVDEDEFVLQCRRCIAHARKKDDTAPDQGKCQDCHRHGQSCRPFRIRRTPAQEQKDRDENDGVDPIYPVPKDRINNADNVLFRCTHCFRAFHFEHLPSLTDELGIDIDADAEQRFREYKTEWRCKECLNMPSKVSGIVAWKPQDEDNYDPTLGLEALDEEDKVYLVRWEGKSYFQARWMPGPWVWGVTASMTRKAFAKREDSRHPKMRTEDAIPEDYLRSDIVLDIKYTSFVDIRTQEVDKARIREVDQALIKYKGLGYEDAVWETPPSPEDGERWSDFVVAYNDWVMGHYVRQPRPAALRSRLEKARKEPFETLEKKTQPANIEGGQLMEYQVLGLNWLYYKWFSHENAILADEMGLGKTIQIIGFLATLVQDWDCYPFLIVVPNSTCPNWRREIKRWAPSLRVVAYYGSRESRDLASRYELYPENSKDLRCHVVVTSYDAAADENCRKFFRGVAWQGLIVDEGQRLKNDKNILYAALGALKVPFKVLLTGTPLQNNARELFNLLQFLDDKQDAAQLETEFEELDAEKIQQLHDKIRPFFLRRTKAQVLTFLPPMAQIIVPVSMTFVQKKLYRSILAKNPDLMRAIFGSDSNLKSSERGSINNILMQLRKCLCHPFVYNKGIEERNVSITASHRNLVDASSKLKLLEILLPKLQAYGHRVLIFSQFLDMLDIVEDFLDGMQLRYQRLDGNVNSLTKQKRIDEFNAPDSQLFAFLLSTRAGGVGINLATADTVIILDPDFNPHQDIQALSRAHRIGQKKKVLCFQIVTRASAEERIMQIGRTKLALDHVLIRNMDSEDANETDLVSVLRHGASELFEDNGEQDIAYDDASVERLLDRTHIENTTTGDDKSAETQFSFARVWANGNATLEEQITTETEQAPDPNVWTNILKERERIAAEEAAAKAEEFGRGRRARMNVDYAGEIPEVEGAEITPIKKRGKRQRQDDGSDTDFQAEDSEPDQADEGEELDSAHKKAMPAFRRALLPNRTEDSAATTFPEKTSSSMAEYPLADNEPVKINCRACLTFHRVGSCPVKLAGVEHCNLCGIAHYGHARVCPHIQSETQVRAMLEALKMSTEPEHLVNEAKRYLRGLKGHLVQMKRQREQKEQQAREQAMAAQAYMTTGYPPYGWT